MVGITNAPLEISHNWRQSLTNMVARNFLETDANIFYPRIDMAGEKTGIIGSEFPFYNYLIYVVSLIFDYSHWYGRLINLIISSIGLFYFYKLVEKLLDKRTAFNSTIILTTSIWFAFSRKIMPDTFSISLMMIGLYYAFSFLKYGNKINFSLFFIFCTLGMLCKIPALGLFSVLAVVVLIKEIPIQRKISIFTGGIISFTLVCLWYFYWVPYLLKTYNYQLYFPKGFKEGITEILPLIPELLEKFYFASFHSYLAFACFVAGVFLLIKSKQRILKLSVTIISIVFILFIIKTGSVFPLHSYYIIPYTPIMALLAGYFVMHIPINFQFIILGLISIESIANQQHHFFIPENKKYKLELEEITKKYIPNNDLIIINGGQSPQNMYFAHRRGWTIDNDGLTNVDTLNSLINLGARYMIIDLTDFDQEFKHFESLYSDSHYNIYELKNTSHIHSKTNRETLSNQ